MRYILDNTYFIEREEGKNIITNKLAIDEQGKVPEWVEVVREGKWSDDWKGDFEYTEEVLMMFKDNYDKNVLRYSDGKIPFNYRHDIGGKASGWIDSMEIRPKLMRNGDNVKSLWAKVSWTPSAKKEIAEGEWKYYSIEDIAEYVDPETQEVYEHVVIGVALTNVPFVTELEPAIRMNSKENKKKEDFAMGMEEQLKTLSVENAEFKSKVTTLSKENDTLKGNVVKLESEVEALKLEAQAKEEAIKKEAEVVDIITEAATKGKKLNPTILDNIKESEEFKLGMENVNALKLAIKHMPELDINTKSRPQVVNPIKQDEGKKELSSAEFAEKAMKLSAEKNIEYKEAVSKMYADGFSYTM